MAATTCMLPKPPPYWLRLFKITFFVEILFLILDKLKVSKALLARLLRETSEFFYKHKTFVCGNPFLSSYYTVSCPFIYKRQSTPHLPQHAINLYLMPEELFEKDAGNPASRVQACHEQLIHESHLSLSVGSIRNSYPPDVPFKKNYCFC